MKVSGAMAMADNLEAFGVKEMFGGKAGGSMESPMPISMIERVARILEPNFDSYQPDAKDMILKDARAVIKAMREPTDGMSSAGELKPFDCHSSVIWRAMIDAALKETK